MHVDIYHYAYLCVCVCDTQYNDKKAVERSGDRLNEIDARSADRWASRQKVGVVTSAGAFNVCDVQHFFIFWVP